MKKVKWLLGLIVVAALALGGFTYMNKAKKAEFVKAKVQRGDIDAVISATGTVNPEISVAVGSVVSGVIIDLMADYNTQVKVDQLVAVIDPAPFQAKVDQAQANLEAAKASIINAQIAIKTADLSIANSKATLANQQYGVVKAKSAVSAAKITLERSKKLLAAGVGLQSDLDTAQANYDQSIAALDSANAQVDAAKASLDSTEANRELADTQMTSAKASVETGKANLDNAQLDLLHTKILSPVNGVVIARNMDKGQTVQASTQAPTLFQIARDLTKMQVETNIDESDISRVQLGQDGTFTVDAYPGQTFHGQVTQIRRSPVNVQNVITYTTVIQVANPDLKLFPGMTANVRLVTEHIPNVIKIPSAAVRFRPPDDLLSAEAKAARDKGNTKSDTKADVKADAKADAKADGKAEAKTDGGFDPSQFKGKGGGGGGGFGRGGGGGGGGFRGGGRGRGGDFAAKQGGGTGTRSQAQVVYILDDKGQLQPERIRVGVADGNFIAMVSGNLKEGDEVVTSILNPKPTAAATGNAPGFPGGNNNNNNFKQGKNFGF